MKYEFDLDFLAETSNVWVNDAAYKGKIAVGDTLTVNGKDYAVVGINEDGIVVKDVS